MRTVPIKSVITTEPMLIKDKIIKVKNIRDLFSFLWTMDGAQQPDGEQQVNISLKYKNESKTELRDEEAYHTIMKTDNWANNPSRLREITISSSWEGPEFVQVTLKHAPDKGESRIEAVGRNATWPLGIQRQLDDIINAFDGHPRIISFATHGHWASWLFVSLIAVFLMSGFCVYPMPNTECAGAVVQAKIIDIWYFILPILLVLSWPLGRLVFKIWPNVEIQIGPKRNFIESYIRKAIYFIFIVVIAGGISGIIIDHIYDAVFNKS